MMQSTFVMLKPDAVERGLAERIVEHFEQAGFVVGVIGEGRLSAETVDAHYAEHVGKYFYPALRDFTMSGKVVQLQVSGENVVARVREMIGATDSSKADPGSIRGLYNEGSGVVRRNLVHASDSPASAERELALHFAACANRPLPGSEDDVVLEFKPFDFVYDTRDGQTAIVVLQRGDMLDVRWLSEPNAVHANCAIDFRKVPEGAKIAAVGFLIGVVENLDWATEATDQVRALDARLPDGIADLL